MQSILTIFWTILVLIAAPLAGILSRRPLAARARPRSLVYAGSAMNLILIAGITAAIDLWRGGESIRALMPVLSASRFLMWTIAISLVCIVIYLLRAKLNRPPSAIVMSLLPETSAEYVFFLALCVLVGLVEEFLFRGFALSTLADLSGSKMLAAAIVTISFALQHGIQDAIGIVRAFVLGVVLVVPVLVTGSLLPSIVAHALVDAFSGLFGRAMIERLGIVLPK
ncbi:MAG TPA: CPBP family intramembrane glutamic endopeptidase [Candidatus Udaeobacter sp.]|nr:CPBP family intramembrane glutamic endopeptidase [Candidatus Udaeobacter sp.]